jgi:hypothetical protein
MKTKTVITVLAVAVMGLVGCMLAGCETTRTYNMPYSQAEAVLFERLHLDKDKTLTSPLNVQAKAQDDLAGPMSMKLFAVELHEHTPGTSLSFTCHHLYNIGAVGGQYIRFDLRKQTTDKTRITVDYCDRWWGIWPPFIFWNPGPFRERNIHNAIWGRETANKVPEDTTRKLADPQY